MLKLNAEETSQEQQQQQQQKTLLSNASADGSPRATTTATSPSQQVSKAKVSFPKAQGERGEVQLQVEGEGSRKKCVRPLRPLPSPSLTISASAIKTIDIAMKDLCEALRQSILRL